MPLLIFVVDDEKNISDGLATALRGTGFDVDNFYDGKSCLTRASEVLPDVLVSDIDMPDLDGVTLARALRHQNPECKLIFMSGNLYRESLETAGLNDFVFLSKPFSLDQFFDLLRSGSHGVITTVAGSATRVRNVEIS